MFGIDLGGFCIRWNRPGVCPVSAAELDAISGGQKVTALNTRTRSGLQEGQDHTHIETHTLVCTGMDR